MTELVSKYLARSQVKVGPMKYKNCVELSFSARLTSIRPVPKTLALLTVTHLSKHENKIYIIADNNEETPTHFRFYISFLNIF